MEDKQGDVLDVINLAKMALPAGMRDQQREV